MKRLLALVFLLIPIDKADALAVSDHDRPSFYLKEIPEFVRKLFE